MERDRAVLRTLCILKYVHSFESSFPMDVCHAFVRNANKLRFHILLPEPICIYATVASAVFVGFFALK